MEQKSGTTENFAFPLVSLEKDKLTRIISENGKFDEDLLNAPVNLLQVTNPLSGESRTSREIKFQSPTTKEWRLVHTAWVAQDQSLKASLSTTYSNYIVKDEDGKVVNADSPLALPKLVVAYPYFHTQTHRQ